MTEVDAQQLVEEIVGGPAKQRLSRFVELVLAENERQNLIARSTVATIWSRHVLDSVQLIKLARGGDRSWLDIGTGGGFPGLVIAIASPDRPMILVEPRKQRAAFLAVIVEELGLSAATVFATRVEKLPRNAMGTISARALGSMETLFEGASHCAGPDTTWLLPRGAGWQKDLETSQSCWKGTFHVEQSLSDPSAGIVIATGVTRR